MRYFFIIITTLLLSSCNSNSEGAVAQYGNYVLTRTDVKNMLPEDMEEEDSLAYVNQIVEQWAKDKVFLQNSKKILSEDELQEIEYKVKRYQDDITTSFIEEKLTKNLNDSISSAEISEYYKTYTDSFELKEDYLAYQYMLVPTDSVSTYKALIKNENYEELKNRLVAYNYTHILKNENWISRKKFDKSNIFPAELQQHNLKRKNEIITIENGNSSFIFILLDYKSRGESAPLPVVKDIIKSVLINKRKLNLLSQKKKELYNEALQDDEIKRN